MPVVMPLPLTTKASLTRSKTTKNPSQEKNFRQVSPSKKEELQSPNFGEVLKGFGHLPSCFSSSVTFVVALSRIILPVDQFFVSVLTKML